ncbi:MAG: hypothetical protein HFI93_08790 [Lachnospiraceae bacterium]|nr:hypothetical protein [Lachnospiraceae bacterium]
MNKKKRFDMGLYREAFRQGKMVGLTTLILLTLESVLIPVGNVISQLSLEKDIARMGETYIPSQEIMNMLAMHPFLMLTFTVATPLLMLYMFHFLTKRNASDYYHSIPQTRNCVFLSFFAAAMSWMFLYVLVPSLLGAGLFSVFSRYFSVNWNNVWHILLNVLAGNMFVASAIAIAICLTGTVFTNMAVSGIIIFVPRIFLAIVTLSVSSWLPMVPDESLLPLLDAKYNVVVGIFANVFIGSGDSLTALSSGVYTLLLGILYALFAMWLFGRRKSEAAGQAAVSRRLQLACRLIMSMLVCLICCSALFGYMVSRDSIDITDVYVLFVIYVIAVVVYFLYELITTRKWRNLAKAVPGLGLLALLNVLTIFGMWGIYNVVLNTTPEAGDIRYVNVLGLDEPTYYNGRQYEDYFAAKVGRIDLDSEEVKELVANRLSEEVRLWKEDERLYGRSMENRQRLMMKIGTGTGSILRYIYLTNEDWEVIARTLEEKEGYREGYRELPNLGVDATLVQVSGLGIADSEAVYRILQEEVLQMDFADWYRAAEDPNLYGDGVLGTLTLVSTIGSETYASVIPITGRLPATAKAYMEKINQDNEKAADEIVSILSDWKDSNYEELNVNFELYGMEDFSWQFYYYAMEGDNNFYEAEQGISWEDLIRVLQMNADKPIDLSGLYGRVEVSISEREEYAPGFGEAVESYHVYNTHYTYYYNMNGLDVSRLSEN